jgi:beta-lactamase superfamily II metal-dependent hydrolase
MMDINHHEDHYDYGNVVGYYKRYFRKSDGTIKPIFRFICTHPHQDHICGLNRLLDDPDIKILNFWDLEHSFEPEEFENHPTHEDDWNAYELLRGEDSPATVIKTSREDTTRLYWNDDEDRISILNPCENLIRHAHYKEDGTKREPQDVEIDEMSYCLVIRVNERKIILPSDGRSSPFWEDILANCKSSIQNCAVLKAGHHGHECSFHEEAVKLINPSLIVFSNSEDEDFANGAEKLYADAVPEALILKTCDHGTITVTVPFDGEESIKYSTTK